MHPSIIPQVETLEPSVDVVISLAETLNRDADFAKLGQDVLRVITTKLVTLATERATPLSLDDPAACLRDTARIVTLCDEVDMMQRLLPAFSRLRACFERLPAQDEGPACVRALIPLLSLTENIRAKPERVDLGDDVFMPLYGLIGSIFQYGMADGDFDSRSMDWIQCLPRIGNIQMLRSE